MEKLVNYFKYLSSTASAYEHQLIRTTLAANIPKGPIVCSAFIAYEISFSKMPTSTDCTVPSVGNLLLCQACSPMVKPASLLTHRRAFGVKGKKFMKNKGFCNGVYLFSLFWQWNSCNRTLCLSTSLNKSFWKYTCLQIITSEINRNRLRSTCSSNALRADGLVKRHPFCC